MSTDHLELKLYSEDEEFLVQGKTEPNSRSQTLIYFVKDTRWWIKVTLIGTITNLLNNGQIQQASKRQRRVLFQDLIRQINYKQLPLLADTVTELILEADTAATKHNLEVGLVGTLGTMEVLNIFLKYKIQEDPLRVVYPASADYPCFRKIHDEELTRDTEISDGVFPVYHNGVQYILKIVNRPLYEPRDTHVFQKELENLEYFTGVPNIVQAEGVAVSRNPYMTTSGSDGPLVVTGILLKAYSDGSLREILLENRVAEYAWKKWPVQIGTALNRFHEAKKTHMDVKPSNIVIDSGGNAVVIDISGIGGITREWCSPEIQDEAAPFDLSFEQRRLNDVWAYGKLLSEIALHARDDPFTKSLEQVAECLMKDNPQSRMSLPWAIR
ncbi:protein kinase domain protein [Aspergillus clavatus NRRL 1]|uniref:Protein kinase domain protein n=1 Tax=Aspergillus clavatus (strain ATCC 1007 / CBS 513.65 / DSM 816 / NCTC 3887 / NRRL 1 / QM 1276 / 107) TaxID=344612 RepID=A1CRU3_ASPCL|nr:protein kinase domain protein [Aspergillus clavatus NRRL 1]EAW08364.1 protein kinase domain protein [Aspergillus clavatus NRRL 1]